MNRLRYISILITLSLIAIVADAQRRVTPVNNHATATQAINLNPISADSLARRNVVEMIDNQGNKVLVDTITGTEWVDTISEPKKLNKMQQPLLFAAFASVDIATPMLRAFGQDHGLVEFSAGVNLHNRYLPTLEIGLGKAEHKPEDNNYTYKSAIAPFFRLGLDYNFMFNSNPDYMFFAGLRYGFTPFSYTVTDITPSGGDYWGDNGKFEIPKQSMTAGYLQLLLGLRVKIIERISLGWTIRYQSLLHESVSPHGEPWYIPGFGSRGSALNFTFSVTYTLPIQRKQLEETISPNPITDDTQGE